MRDKLGRFVKGQKPWNHGIPRNIRTKRKISKTRIERIKEGKIDPNFKKGHKINVGRKRPKHSEFMKKNCKFVHYSGDKNPNYRNGLYVSKNNPRNSKEYKLWRKSIFERDNYTCIWCGQIGGILHADHIKQFALFPELRFAIDNGRTLCLACHKTTDSYLKAIKKEDLIKSREKK